MKGLLGKMNRPYLIVVFLVFILFGQLLGQEKRLISINSDLFRASYEKLSAEAFNKLWDESVSQQLKITLLDQNLKIKLVLGGGIVSFEELKKIPELNEMMKLGTFPDDKIFVKHVCQVEFGFNTNFKPILEAGISLPHRITYIESLPVKDASDPVGIKKRNLRFFKEYFDMMINRFDKSTLAFENSILPRQLVLKTGEQFAVERFLLASIGFGTDGIDIKANNPVLIVKGNVRFVPFRFSKTFQHTRVTIQNFGHETDFRVTVSKKNINTFEFLNTDFGFDIKTQKKLFELLRLNIGFKLFHFTPTWNFYQYKHNQFTGEINDVRDFNLVKRGYYFGEKNFLNHVTGKMDYFRTYQIRGRSFSNDINIFNIYENSHQESIENRFIDSNMNTRENIGFGSFQRYKSIFFNQQKMSLDISNDYSFRLNQFPNKQNRSGISIKFSTDDVHGISNNKKWYLNYFQKILEDLATGSTSEFDFIFEKYGEDQFQRLLKIELDSDNFDIIFKDKKVATKKVLDYYQKIFEPDSKDNNFNKSRKAYVRAMLIRIINRVYNMNELLEFQFQSSLKKQISMKKFETPGQLPIHDLLYLLIAVAVDRENCSIEYQLERLPNRESLMESKKSKVSYQFAFIGKNFVKSFDMMEFYY